MTSGFQSFVFLSSNEYQQQSRSPIHKIIIQPIRICLTIDQVVNTNKIFFCAFFIKIVLSFHFLFFMLKSHQLQCFDLKSLCNCFVHSLFGKSLKKRFQQKHQLFLSLLLLQNILSQLALLTFWIFCNFVGQVLRFPSGTLQSIPAKN